MNDTIKQNHIHLKAQRFKDGRWVIVCLHHECDYEEEITPAKAWEQEL